jgi:nucleoside-diphosphate-sugar epimerase
MTKKALVCGGGGFIGSHLVTRLKKEGWFVRAVDLNYPEFRKTEADEFVIGDLRDPRVVDSVLDIYFDRVYQLAADMGGAGFIFTGENDAEIMHNSAMINLNIAKRASQIMPGLVFFSSSVCLYPDNNPLDKKIKYNEERAYPAMPTNEYGWEKLFSERVYQNYSKNRNLKIKIARFHNTFGPEGKWTGGREKAPAAMCRKVAETKDGGTIEIWGDGKQTRQFVFIDDLLEGVERLINSDFSGPVDISPKETISIDELVDIVASVSGKKINKAHIPGPVGVTNRKVNSLLMKEKLGWTPEMSVREGIEKTYPWIEKQVKSKKMVRQAHHK